MIEELINNVARLEKEHNEIKQTRQRMEVDLERTKKEEHAAAKKVMSARDKLNQEITKRAAKL